MCGHGHGDGHLRYVHCKCVVPEHDMMLAEPADLPFPVSAFATLAEFQLHRCEHHAHLSACAFVFGHTVHLHCQTLATLIAVAGYDDRIEVAKLSSTVACAG